MTEISGKIPLILKKLWNKSPQNKHFNNGTKSSIQINIWVLQNRRLHDFIL